jgi:hypothetical protein
VPRLGDTDLAGMRGQLLFDRGVALWLARVCGTSMAELQASGLTDRLGPRQPHATSENAVQAYTTTRHQAPPDSS